MARLLLGVDGGATKTRALLADLAGRVVGAGTAGSSNYQSVGLERAVTAIVEAIRAAFADARLMPGEDEVAAACFGLAGVDRPDDRERLSGRLERERLGRRMVIVNDSELVLAAGCSDGWGVAVISGTGSICFGRAPDGRTTRAGGWGYILGDEGSGFDIAVQALRLATRTADGRANAPGLLRAALTFWELDAPEQLIGLIYQREAGAPGSVARFATRVLELAEAGDPDARQVLERAADDLALHVATVAWRLGLERPPVAFGGGVLRASALLRQAVYERAGVPLGPAAVVDDPALGALAIARRLAEAPG
uniref:BadF/BadG/BcrA/BcrD type ATPase n=1 Tax=Thermorudis peleae TaxID=1382356 RepID=A0A831X8M6_9BACT